MRKNCSRDREKPLKFEAESREFSKCLRSLEQFIQTVKGQNNFWYQNAFLTCSWRFLISDKLEYLIRIQIEKIVGIQKHAGKARKIYCTLAHLMIQQSNDLTSQNNSSFF